MPPPHTALHPDHSFHSDHCPSTGEGVGSEIRKALSRETEVKNYLVKQQTVLMLRSIIGDYQSSKLVHKDNYNSTIARI